MTSRFAALPLALVLASSPVSAQSGAGPKTPEALANAAFNKSFLADNVVSALQDQQVLQRASQVYLWALPALNMYGMKEGSERTFGSGYNVLPIFKDRLNAKTLITTPNSDVIYALGYLDLTKDGPIVIEVPPGLQGILDDFWQRPIARKARSTEKSGAAMWACLAPTRERAESILCFRQTTRAKFRRDL